MTQKLTLTVEKKRKRLKKKKAGRDLQR